MTSGTVEDDTKKRFKRLFDIFRYISFRTFAYSIFSIITLKFIIIFDKRRITSEYNYSIVFFKYKITLVFVKL